MKLVGCLGCGVNLILISIKYWFFFMLNYQIKFILYRDLVYMKFYQTCFKALILNRSLFMTTKRQDKVKKMK